MNCPFSNEQLCAWAQGEEDDAAVASAIVEHLAACAPCQSVVREMRTVLFELKAAALAPPPATPALPQTIGRYRILGRLGEGGMGVVYDAEQAEPKRRVALKVIRGALGGDEWQRRLFAREVQTLARLSHPHIAAIYDAGRTEHDEPYFAMEYVDGVELRRFVAGPPPTPLRERVQLLLLIARAMSHAHERGVIHRDLKPGNILISRNAPDAAVRAAGGEPKILDFGLARALEADKGDERTTRAGTVVGTFAYMSPEQARGDAEQIDIRTDVYALGVVLYELLTGQLPIDVLRTGASKAAERIENDAPRDPRSLNGAIPRDVAIIALKCLEKSPQRRYASAGELAADLERFLDGRPIVARPASPLYQLQRFVARNALPVTLLSLLFAAISIGAIVATAQAQRIASERDRVLAEATKVARLNGVLENLWASIDPWKAGDRNVRVIDALHDIARRVETEMADTPLLAASVRNTLGNTWRSLGTIEDYAESERHLRFALTQRREHLTSLGTVSDSQRAAAELDASRSANDLAETLYWKGEFDEARALLASAIEIRRRRLPANHADLGESINNLGSVLKRLDQMGQAGRCYEEALAIRDAAYQRALADSTLGQRERAAAADDLAETRNNRAALLRALANEPSRAGPAAERDTLLARALEDYRAALELRRVWLGDAHPSTATSHNNFGRALQDAQQYAAAEAEFRESLRILRKGLGEKHQLIARALHNLAKLKLETGDRAAARETGLQALAMRAELLGPEHPETLDSARLRDDIERP